MGINNPELKEQIAGLTEAGDIYEYFINRLKPDENVLVIGPGKSIRNDPTLLGISMLLADRPNKLFVVDPIYNENEHLHGGEGIDNWVKGVGNYDSINGQLNDLSGSGLPLAQRIWLGPESRAQHIVDLQGVEIPAGSIHLVGDHCTTEYLCRTVTVDGYSRREDQIILMRMILGEYSRVLAKGGILLFQSNNQLFGFNQNVKYSSETISVPDEFNNAGFDCLHLKIKDTWYAKVKADVFEKLAWIIAEVRYSLEQRSDDDLYGAEMQGNAYNGEHLYIGIKS